MSVEPGAPAPDFTLPIHDGSTVTLSDLKGKPVVIYFYPKDDTPGCTKQACGFRDAHPDFSALDATIIGISKDSVAKHETFRAKNELPFMLASDADSDVCERYGVWAEKSMYGKTYMGIERTTVLIDKDGVVREVWRKVKVPGHVDVVLDAVKGL